MQRGDLVFARSSVTCILRDSKDSVDASWVVPIPAGTPLVVLDVAPIQGARATTLRVLSRDGKVGWVWDYAVLALEAVEK